MDNSLGDKILEYGKLTDEYRKKFSGDIEIKEEDGIYVNDYMIFPSDFMQLNDFSLKNRMLKNSLETNTRLEDLEELRDIHEMLNSRKLDRNIQEVLHTRK